MPIKQDPTAYSASSIVVRDGLDVIRFRPGMYLPGSPSEALVDAVVGGLWLSLEAVASGRATELVLTVGDGLSFSVADSGSFPELRGAYPNTDMTLGEALLVLLTACRDLEPAELANGSGVMLVIPNALSRRTTLSVVDQGAWWTMEFRDGKLVSRFTKGELAEGGGVCVTFDLDPRFFPGAQLDEDVVRSVVARAAVGVGGGKVVVRDGRGVAAGDAAGWGAGEPR